MVLNNLRNLSFRLTDLLSGNKIGAHYKDISTTLDLHAQKKLSNVDNQKVDKLLCHATKSTEFYEPYKDFRGIRDFPVIKKNTVRDNFEKFKSVDYLNQKYFKVSTSGSTGMPFFLFQDMNKRKRNTADVIYYFKKSGHEVGNKLYEFEVWRNHNKKGRLKSFMQNVHQFDVSKLTDERILELFKILKNDNSAKTFLGFASAYESICAFIEKNKNLLPLNFNINAIIANSEYLNAYTREAMGKFFQAAVLSRYSNEEMGIIAQQTLDSGDDFVINWASYYVELLDFNSDTPVEKGKPGRIVVTDLYNYYMPLIRFDTGDVGVFTNSEGKELPNFKHIEGRKMDLIYDTSGKMVSSFVVYTKFYDYYKLLKQYQFIQKDKKEYLIKLNLAGNTFDFEEELVRSVKSDFGDDAVVKIEYVDEIPPLASGKRKKVVSSLDA